MGNGDSLMPRQRSSSTVLSLMGWNPSWPFEKFPRKRQNPVLLWLLVLVQALYILYIKTNDSLTILVLPNSFWKVTEQKPQELVPSIAQTIPLPFGMSRLLVNWWRLYSHIDSYRNQAFSNHKKIPEQFHANREPDKTKTTGDLGTEIKLKGRGAW